jgi:hypothetical protein
MLAFLLAAYHEEEVRGEKRTLLRLDPRLAPVAVAVLPLSRNERLNPVAHEVADLLRPRFMIDSTTPAPSGVATAARTRWGRRGASRSTSTPSTTGP